VKKFLTDKRTALCTLATFIFFFAIYIPYVRIKPNPGQNCSSPALTSLLIKFNITPYGLQWGVSLNMAFYLSSILNTGTFFGCYTFGVAADRGLGYFNALTAVAFGCAITAFGWIGTRNNAGIIVWSIIYGLLSGALQALFSPCISYLAPEPGLIGTWNGRSIDFFQTLLNFNCALTIFNQESVSHWLPLLFLEPGQSPGGCLTTRKAPTISLCNCLLQFS
jgi:MFS family permease